MTAPLDQPVARLADLLGDRDGVAGGEQPRQVVVERVVGDAGHRHPAVAAEGARGQGDPGVAGDDAGVLVEGLVEVAEAVEQDRVGMLRLRSRYCRRDGTSPASGSSPDRARAAIPSWFARARAMSRLYSAVGRQLVVGSLL